MLQARLLIESQARWYKDWEEYQSSVGRSGFDMSSRTEPFEGALARVGDLFTHTRRNAGKASHFGHPELSRPVSWSLLPHTRPSATAWTNAADNLRWRNENGKVAIRNMVVSGGGSWAAPGAEDMANEMSENVHVEVFENSGYYLAEENPDGFVTEVLKFIEAEA